MVLFCFIQIYRVFGDNQEYETIRLNETLAAYGDDSRVSRISLLPACYIKGALYRIQILCRRYTFWSYPAGLTIADPPG